MGEIQKLIVLFVCCIWLYFIIKTTINARKWSLFTWIFLVAGMLAITTATVFDFVLCFISYKEWIHITIKSLFTIGAIAYTIGIIGWSKLTISIIQRLEVESKKDHLTGLLNRQGILDFFNQNIKTYNELYIIVADIDGTKLVNDTFGHLEGDKIIIKTAQVLKNIFEPGGAVGRIGGDEFIVIVPEIHLTELNRSLAILRKEISQLMLNKEVPISISIGYSSYINDGNDITTLLRVADQRMYNEKNSKVRAKGGTRD